MAFSDVEHLFRFTGEFSETIIASAGGAFVRDRDGREILDFTSGQMSAILGHSHPEIVATVGEAVARLDHLHSSFLSDVVLEFTSALSALLPASLSKVLPLSTGAESNEAAIRMAKLATGRFEVVAFDRSWHGVTGGASAATFNGARRGYGAPVPGVLALPTPHAYRSPFASNGTYDWRAELDFGFELIDRQSVGSLAAMIAEPDSELGGHHRASGRLPHRACRALPAPRDAAHPRRGADRPRADRGPVRVRARRGGAGHPDPVQDARRGAAVVRDRRLPGGRAGVFRARLPVLHDPHRGPASGRGRDAR